MKSIYYLQINLRKKKDKRFYYLTANSYTRCDKLENVRNVIGWGAGSAYSNFLLDFPIVDGTIHYLVDSNYKVKKSLGNICVKNPSTLDNENKSNALIIIFSEHFTEILSNPILQEFKNIITVWDIRKSPDKYINLILSASPKKGMKYIPDRKIILEKNSEISMEKIFNQFYNYFQKSYIGSINLGNVLKTELLFLSEYMTDSNKEYLLYETVPSDTLKFAIIGDGDILVSSLLYNRLDHANLMNLLANNIGNEKVVKLIYYDDYIKMKGILKSEKVKIFSYNIDKQFIEKNMIKTNELWEYCEFYYNDKIKSWLNNHVAYSIGLIKIYEELLEAIKVSKGIFVNDTFRDEYLLSTLLNIQGKSTYRMQHGFYPSKQNGDSYLLKDEIYLTHSPSKKKLVWGELGKAQLCTWGILESDILVIGNPKYKNYSLINEHYKQFSSASYNILVVLGVLKKDNDDLLDIILKYKMEKKMNANVFIKLHPRYDGDLSALLNRDIVIINEMFDKKLLDTIDVSCTVASTAYFELLTQNIYVLMKDNNNRISNNKSTTFSNYEEFLGNIEKWNSSEKYREEYVRNAKQELNLCFSTENEVLKEEFNN